MGGCLGCCYCKKSTLLKTVDEAPKQVSIEDQTQKKQSLIEDFWSSSTCDMENSAVQSQGSISSISTTNQTADQHGGAGGANAPSEFVNHGLLLWNQTRQQWVGNKRSEKQARRPRETKLSWNRTYDSLLGSNKPFPQPIPLSEMVDFLVDVWEQEGMYD